MKPRNFPARKLARQQRAVSRMQHEPRGHNEQAITQTQWAMKPEARGIRTKKTPKSTWSFARKLRQGITA